MVTETHREPSAPHHDYDVIVCGGGSAGVAAAIAAARAGVRCALIEMAGRLGGVWTSGLMNQVIDFQNKAGLMEELMSTMEVLESQQLPHIFDPEAVTVLLERLCREAGVEIRLYTRVIDAHSADGRVHEITTSSNSGSETWRAPVYVDATGNGDLAALAGCRFDVGHPDSGLVQPMTLRALVAGPPMDEISGTFVMPHGTSEPWQKERLYEEIRRGGHTPSYSMPSLLYIRDGFYGMMANHEYGVSALDAAAMTEATLDGREELVAIVAALRSLGGPWRDLHLVASAAHIGIREARRIQGRYTITRDDLVNGKQHDDAVCTATYWVDIHSLDPGDGSSYSDEGVSAKPYQVPLRSLIARDVDNLLMAGRCISGDFYAHASYRVTGNAVPMGEAAGRCAAIAALDGVSPATVDWARLDLPLDKAPSQ